MRLQNWLQLFSLEQQKKYGNYMNNALDLMFNLLGSVTACFYLIYYHNKKEEISKVYRDDITRKAIVSKSRLVQHFSLDNKKWAYDFNIPIEGMSKNMIGFIRVGISSEVIDDEIIKLRNRTLVIMVFFLVFSSVIILMLNKFTILEPMHILLEGMNKYGGRRFWIFKESASKSRQ